MDPTSAASLVALEPQQIRPLLNQRLAQGEISSSDWCNAEFPALAVGQEIDGLVLEILDGGRLLINLVGTPVEAEGPADLRVGQHLRLRVERLKLSRQSKLRPPNSCERSCLPTRTRGSYSNR